MSKKEKYETPLVEVVEIKANQRFMEDFIISGGDAEGGASAKEHDDNSINLWDGGDEEN